MKADKAIAEHYKNFIAARNGIPPKEYFKHPTDGHRVDNAVTIPVRLLNRLLNELNSVK